MLLIEFLLYLIVPSCDADVISKLGWSAGASAHQILFSIVWFVWLGQMTCPWVPISLAMDLCSSSSVAWQRTSSLGLQCSPYERRARYIWDTAHRQSLEAVWFWGFAECRCLCNRRHIQLHLDSQSSVNSTLLEPCSSIIHSSNPQAVSSPALLVTSLRSLS